MISFDDAAKAVDQFELMAYFHTVSPGARVLIAEELAAMVNWPRERVVRNGYGIVAYVEPKDRLTRLMKAMKQVREWPGMAEIRALYCQMYSPADGHEVECCTIPGFTLEECESGTDYFSLERGKEPERKYLPQPGDVPNDILAQIPGAAKRLGGGK